MGAIVVIYNRLGLVFAGLGILAGVVAGNLGLPALAAVGVAGVVIFALDLGYRLSRRNMENGGSLYHIPIWIIGCAFAMVSALFLYMRHLDEKSHPPSHDTSSSTVAWPTPYSSAPPPPPPPDPKVRTLSMDTSVKFRAFAEKLLAITSSDAACEKKAADMDALKQANLAVLKAVYEGGAFKFPAELEKPIEDTLQQAIKAGESCNLDMWSISNP